MKFKVQKHLIMPSNIKEMKVALQEISDVIGHTTFVQLIKSMPKKHMASVIKAKGRLTNW